MELSINRGTTGINKETHLSSLSVSSEETSDENNPDSLANDDRKLLHESTDIISKEKAKKVYKFKCKFSGTISDVMTRRGWVEQEDEFSDNFDIFWCDVNQLRDMFILTNTRLQEHQRISHFRSCFEICRKNLMVKNLKRLQSRIRKTIGKEEGEKLNFFPTTYILPTDHKIFLQEFRRISNNKSYWIIKPAAGAQGRGIFIFSQLHEYNSWRKCYNETLRHMQLSTPINTTSTTISPESSIAPYMALSVTQLHQNAEPVNDDVENDQENDSDNDNDSDKDADDDINHSLDSSQQLCDTDTESMSIKIEHSRLNTPLDNNIIHYKMNDSDIYGSTLLRDAVYNNPSEGTKDKKISTPVEVPKNLIIRADIFVMQRYIQDPYLIGGRKFDLRIFVLVTSDLKWALRKFRSYLISRHGRHEVFRLMNKIDTIVVRTLQSILHVVIPDRNSFELYGFDVLIDVNMKPWLLEVNASPAFTPSSEEDYRLKCCLLDDTASVLDLEGRRTGKEKQVGGYDLFWDNGPVYAEPVCNYGSPDRKNKKPKLNSFLGCESNRHENLVEMYKNARNARKTQKILSDERITIMSSLDE